MNERTKQLLALKILGQLDFATRDLREDTVTSLGRMCRRARVVIAIDQGYIIAPLEETHSFTARDMKDAMNMMRPLRFLLFSFRAMGSWPTCPQAILVC